MRNNIGLYHLFGENNKSKKLFYEWCKTNEELCEYDIEMIGHDLGLPCIDNTPKYIYFSNGNILDFLESKGYYIGLPLRGEYKYVTCCYFKEPSEAKYQSVKRPFYNNSGIVGRTKALEIGVTKCIEHLEKTL